MRRLALLFAALVTACAPQSAPPPPPSAQVIAPAFGDSDPHDWTGRRPESYPVHGTDASRWNFDIDWPAARRAGVNFTFLKATEGGDRLDPTFQANWTAAARAGIPRGAYHFFYFCTDARTQARWFIQNVPRTRGALPPVLDLEWNPHSPTCRNRPPPETVRAMARRFLDIVERHYRQRPIVYTTPGFWDDNGLGQLRGVDWWLRSTADHPAETFPGIRWTFWQYSGTGRIPGFSTNADLNVFSGAPAAWSRWLSTRQAR